MRILKIEKLSSEEKIKKIFLNKGEKENLTYIMIKNLSLIENETKIVYLNRINNLSNSVCIIDEEKISEDFNISSVNCTDIICDGNTLGSYKCQLEDNTFVISGLKNSLVIEWIMPPDKINSSSRKNSSERNSSGGRTNQISTNNQTQNQSHNQETTPQPMQNLTTTKKNRKKRTIIFYGLS